MEDQKIREILIEKSDSFRRLYLRHQELEEKLLLMQGRKAQWESDSLEEHEIKKHKLKLKDAMQKQIIHFRQRLVGYE